MTRSIAAVNKTLSYRYKGWAQKSQKFKYEDKKYPKLQYKSTHVV